MTRPADIYLRFLKLAEAVRGLPTLAPLDPLEERILELQTRKAALAQGVPTTPAPDALP